MHWKNNTDVSSSTVTFCANTSAAKTTEVELPSFLFFLLFFNYLFLFVIPSQNITGMRLKIKISIDWRNFLLLFWLQRPCGMSDNLLELAFCCFCCVSFTLEAPSPIQAASIFLYLFFYPIFPEPVITSTSYRIYVLLFGCHCTTVLFTYASTIHVKSVYMWSIVLCLFKYGASNEFPVLHKYISNSVDLECYLYNACSLIHVHFLFFLIYHFRRGKGGGNM